MNPHSKRRGAYLYLALVVLSLLCPGLSALAQPADPPGGYRIVSWNMQRKYENWRFVADELALNHQVLALQEVPLTALHGVTYVRSHAALPSPNHDRDRSGAIREYRWEIEGVAYSMFILSNNVSTEAALNGLNTAIILPAPRLQDPNNPGQMIQHAPQEISSGMTGRTGLLVWDANTQSYWGSFHAMSGSGNDGPSLARNMITTARLRQPGASVTIMGDWNRDPGDWTTQQLIPQGAGLYRSHMATHDNGSELDYMISTVNTDRWRPSRALNDQLRSDHRPWSAGSMAGAAENVDQVVIESGLSDLVLDPGPNSHNGSFVMAQPYTGAPSQKWFVVRITSGNIPNAKPVYRIVNAESMQCLDAYKGITLLADCHLPDPLNLRPAPDARTQEFVREPIPGMDENSFLWRNLTTQEAITALGVENGSTFAPSPADAADPAQVFHMRSAE